MHRSARQCLIAALVIVAAAEDAAPFPYPLPLLQPAPPAVAEVTRFPAPITEAERVRIADGHFVDAAGRRVRLVGVNITSGAAFPSAEEAPRIARRLRSYGINAVRLHHLDAPWAKPSIFHATGDGYGKPTARLDPVSAERLVGFIVALGTEGIHVDLNLKVTREFSAADGFPDADRLPPEGKIVGYFDEQAIVSQENYARDLLALPVPGTTRRLVDLHNLAIVEVNNEDSIFHPPGRFALLPGRYKAQLIAGWNDFLREQHRDTAGMLSAWNAKALPLGAERLPSFPAEGAPPAAWGLETQGSTGGKVTLVPVTGEGQRPSGGALRVSDLRIDRTDWHLQLHGRGLALTEGERYTVEFSMRADSPRRVMVNARHDQDPWGFVGLDGAVAVEREWRRHRLAFTAAGTRGLPIRLSFMLGDNDTPIEVAQVSLRPGDAFALPAGQTLEAGTVDLVPLGDTAPGRDLAAYLMRIESRYAVRMRTHLRDRLGVRSAIGISQSWFGGTAGVVRDAEADISDQHAYWQHPEFPASAWDPERFKIRNSSILKAANNGSLGGLSWRVAGKPSLMTEYNHPAPSEYAAECVPIAFATAALQDCDGLFLFAYHGNADWSGGDRITGFFDSAGHPAMLAHLPAMSAAFRDGWIAPQPATATLVLPRPALSGIVASGRHPHELWSATDGSPTSEPDLLAWRSAIELAATGSAPATRHVGKPGASTVVRSRTPGQETLTIDLPQLNLVAGFAAGRTTTVGTLRIAAEPTPRGFLTASLVSVDGAPIARARRLLLTLIDKAENPGVEWSPDRTTPSQAWARGPVEVHGVTATVTLRGIPAATVTPIGVNGPLAPVPTEASSEGATFRVAPSQRALWYRIDITN